MYAMAAGEAVQQIFLNLKRMAGSSLEPYYADNSSNRFFKRQNPNFLWLFIFASS
jgi:hypothetical protein